MHGIINAPQKPVDKTGRFCYRLSRIAKGVSRVVQPSVLARSNPPTAASQTFRLAILFGLAFFLWGFYETANGRLRQVWDTEETLSVRGLSLPELRQRKIPETETGLTSVPLGEDQKGDYLQISESPHKGTKTALHGTLSEKAGSHIENPRMATPTAQNQSGVPNEDVCTLADQLRDCSPISAQQAEQDQHGSSGWLFMGGIGEAYRIAVSPWDDMGQPRAVARRSYPPVLHVRSVRPRATEGVFPLHESAAIMGKGQLV